MVRAAAQVLPAFERPLGMLRGDPVSGECHLRLIDYATGGRGAGDEAARQGLLVLPILEMAAMAVGFRTRVMQAGAAS